MFDEIGMEPDELLSIIADDDIVDYVLSYNLIPLDKLREFLEESDYDVYDFFFFFILFIHN